MINYYNKRTNKFNCEKAYKYFIKKTGTDRSSKMSEKEIIIFEALCHLKRKFITVDLLEAQNEVNHFLKLNFQVDNNKEQIVNLLKL